MFAFLQQKHPNLALDNDHNATTVTGMTKQNKNMIDAAIISMQQRQMVETIEVLEVLAEIEVKAPELAGSVRTLREKSLSDGVVQSTAVVTDLLLDLRLVA